MKRRSNRQRFRMSPLTVRILVVNLIAPLIFLIGVFQLFQYEEGLLDVEFDSLRVQGNLIAAAIGEGTILPQTTVLEDSQVSVTKYQISPETAQTMIRRLAQLANVRARLFNNNGILIADSNRLVGPGGLIEAIELDPVMPLSLSNWLKRGYEAVNRFLYRSPTLPKYVEKHNQTASDYPGAIFALENGTSSLWLYHTEHGHRLLMAAVPVTYYKQVIGVVLVSRNDAPIQQTILEIRTIISHLFFEVVAVTILLSLYLAHALSRPIHKLAQAAERIRTIKNRHVKIPDLSSRGDEIGNLSVSLRKMTEALQERMNAIERFAADVSHEIKNPLTSLRSAVETLLLIRDPEKQQKLFNILKDDIGRLDRLITDISSASRLDAELSRAEMSRVSLASMLETLRDVYTVVGEERHIQILVNLPEGDSLVVFGIEDRLVQVVRNLLGNALSFSPDGGHLILSAYRDKAHIVITLDDEGPGIPPGKEEAIFQRFYTERPVSEKFGAHSGLGLSISQQIITAHSGTIVASNHLAPDGAITGARFTISLPSL